MASLPRSPVRMRMQSSSGSTKILPSPISPFAPDRPPRMMALIERLYPICRSITGDGVRETLSCLKARLHDLTIHEVPSGTRAFDWTVPDEWNIADAYVTNAEGRKVIDFRKCNLHVMGYSNPVDLELDLSELKEHLYTLPEQPTAIPYVTYYYARG